MTDDIWNDPEMLAWAADVRRDLVPKLRASAISMSIVPQGDPDWKYALELGMSIAMNKPVILLVRPGVQVPEKLIRVADEIVEMREPLNSPGNGKRIKAAVDRVFAAMLPDA